MDSRGRLFLGDRGNNRIQIFDQDGNFIDQWAQFSRPSGVYIDKNDVIYVADSESGSVNKTRADWKRGIRVGSAKDGKVTAFIPDPDENATGTSAAEGVAADAQATSTARGRTEAGDEVRQEMIFVFAAAPSKGRRL